MIISGRAYRLSERFNDINTDEILSGPYLRLPEEQLGEYAFHGIIDDFKNQVQGFKILIAGKNMGCGSSREQAPKALLGCGIKLILAHSFGRIFYRNATNLGLVLLKVSDEKTLNLIETGDCLKLNIKDGEICINNTINKKITPMDAISLKILQADGLINLLKNNILLK